MNPKRKEVPWYTKSLISLLGKGKRIEGSRYSYNPESVNIIYNMFSDELGFEPSMVNRLNILTRALPKEIASYVKTGEVSEGLQSIRNPLLDIYLNKDSQSQSDLLRAILKYDEDNNLYTDKGRKFVQKATESGLLNEETIRDLYFKKYKDKYPLRD